MPFLNALIICRLDHASNSTEHGTANTVFLPGGALQKKNVPNTAPDLDQGNLRRQIDFRSVYASVFKDELGANDTAILGSGFEQMRGLM